VPITNVFKILGGRIGRVEVRKFSINGGEPLEEELGKKVIREVRSHQEPSDV